MDWNEYIVLANRTAKPLEYLDQITHARLGMITEIGELADHFKRVNIYGKPFDRANFIEEVGDVCWYIALECVTADLKLHFHPVDSFKLTEREVIFHPVDSFKLTEREVIFSLSRIVGHLLDQQPKVTMLEMLVSKLRQLCLMHAVPFELCLKTNIAKLAARYGDKYSDQAALIRDLVAERQVLEQA